ncbi:hypothetical protein HHI36_009079 [Cryptolaemus montrouzieri]|uniref:Uncharacterized protein n=1 Tax=Cryptolaemus montrouzieri TaxID=559131 RepID=A0ABD2MUC8_9CUCU
MNEDSVSYRDHVRRNGFPISTLLFILLSYKAASIDESESKFTTSTSSEETDPIVENLKKIVQLSCKNVLEKLETLYPDFNLVKVFSDVKALRPEKVIERVQEFKENMLSFPDKLVEFFGDLIGTAG